MAAANGAKVHTFTSIALPGHAIWNRDIDNSAKPDLLHRLAFHTGTDIRTVEKTVLSSYEGILFERHNPHGLTPWIKPAGIHHRTRFAYGLSFCPLCLDEPVTYYRTQWRLAFVTVCTTHSCRLLDRCQHCQSPIIFHRGDMGKKRSLNSDTATMVICWKCRSDLRHVRLRGDAYIDGMLPLQAILADTIAYGYTHRPRNEPLHSLLFFAGFRILLQLVAASRNAADLQRLLARCLGLRKPNIAWRADIRSYENLDVDARRETAVLASRLFLRWPEEFIHLSRASGTYASDIIGKTSECPYWLESVINERLFGGVYSPTLPEIGNAIAFLRRRRRAVTKMAVSRLLGASDIIRKRQLSFMLKSSEKTRCGDR